jgi:hypothetical protein
MSSCKKSSNCIKKILLLIASFLWGDYRFTPTAYGHSGLLEMIKNYDLLLLKKEDGGHYTVKLNPMLEAGGSDSKLGTA